MGLGESSSFPFPDPGYSAASPGTSASSQQRSGWPSASEPGGQGLFAKRTAAGIGVGPRLAGQVGQPRRRGHAAVDDLDSPSGQTRVATVLACAAAFRLAGLTRTGIDATKLLAAVEEKVRAKG